MYSFQTHLIDTYLEHFLSNCPQVNATGPHWWYINIGWGRDKFGGVQFAHDNPKLRRNRLVGGNFLRSMLPAENAQLFDQWCNVQNTARKLRNSSFPNICLPCQHNPFRSHMRSMNSPKNITCACSGLSGWRQWPWNTHSMSAGSCTVSFVAGYLCEEFSVCCVLSPWTV